MATESRGARAQQTTRSNRQADERADEQNKAREQGDPSTVQGESSGNVQAATEQVADNLSESLERGYWGAVSDPTPNENYTVQGVTSGAPTPETDPELARQVGSARFRGSAVEQQGDREE